MLQDADRLDAIGAIGIARCFATCGRHEAAVLCGRRSVLSRARAGRQEWGIDHFYRKLLRIGDGLHTATARAIADERITFMRAFLDQLERELPAK